MHVVVIFMLFLEERNHDRGAITNGAERPPLAYSVVCTSTSQRDDGVFVPCVLVVFFFEVGI